MEIKENIPIIREFTLVGLSLVYRIRNSGPSLQLHWGLEWRPQGKNQIGLSS